ncbi:MAG: Asp-tRNA(Asn)/Glu-tRNA(Gln) amidotransferase GatCAB subunit A [Phycisphaerae bacterium]|nr:Asp-tRNA(Asn)/Glu-tRNA(Gln) amidotransferase GatCAB subunit A [Phycisphaerae bacterium]
MSSATGIADAVRAGDVSAAETVAIALGRVEDGGAGLNAFLEVFAEQAIDQARAVDTRIAGGDADRMPLAGVPIAVKDNIALAWGRTTAGSRYLEHYRSPFTATAAQRLVDAGAVVVGKTNMDEFGMGSSGEHSAFGPTRHPLDPERAPGGSSSGSAAAVGAGMVPLALGSDTGGSIRQPAALCGCVGLKPTYGRVSRYGLVAYASSLDQIGPLASSVRDAAACLAVMSGEDARDMTSSAHPVVDLIGGLETPVEKLRVGVPKLHGGMHSDVSRAMTDAALALKTAGAEIVDVEMPFVDEAVSAYYIVAPAEASSNLARYDGVRYGHRADVGLGGSIEEMYVRSRSEGFGPEVKRRVMLGAHVLSAGYQDAFYLTALKTRRLIRAGFDAAFDPAGPGVHAILTPVTPGPAFRLGEKTGDPMAMYLEDVFTVTANLAGLPAISLPVGWSKTDAQGREAKLPIGAQLIGRPFDEATLVRVARMLEMQVGWGG